MDKDKYKRTRHGEIFEKWTGNGSGHKCRKLTKIHYRYRTKTISG